MDSMKASFSENLKRLRLLSGETQAELGESVNVAKTTINMYEKGNRLPSLETVKDLAAHFGVSVDYLLRSIVPEDNEKRQADESEIDSENNVAKTLEIYCPLYIDENSLSNRNYEKAVSLAKKLYGQFQDGKQVDTRDFMDCYDYFSKAFLEKHSYSVVGCMWASCLLWIYRFEEFFKTVDKEKTITYQLLSDFYKEKSEDYLALKKELLAFDGGFELRSLEYMRSRSDLRGLGDYYYALRYILDMVDNDLPSDMNALVGRQLMRDLYKLNNPHAIKLASVVPGII